MTWHDRGFRQYHPADAADFQGGTLPTGTVNFAAGQASPGDHVNVAGDTAVEPDETFTVTLSNPVGAGSGLVNATASGAILNDDGGVGRAAPAPASGTWRKRRPASCLPRRHGLDPRPAARATTPSTPARATTCSPAGRARDHFGFGKEPWSPERITDFQVGTDKLDLSALFQKVGYTGSDPVADHYVTFLDDGAGGTKLLFDDDGAGPHPQYGNYIIQLDHVLVGGPDLGPARGRRRREHRRFRRRGDGGLPAGPQAARAWRAGGSTPPPPAVALVVFAGQSNMGAHGRRLDRHQPLVARPADPDLERPTPQVRSAAARREHRLRRPPTGWGPEVEFAIDFRAAHPGETLYIVKSVAGGHAAGPGHRRRSPPTGRRRVPASCSTRPPDGPCASAAAGGSCRARCSGARAKRTPTTRPPPQAYGANLTNLFSAIRSELAARRQRQHRLLPHRHLAALFGRRARRRAQRRPGRPQRHQLRLRGLPLQSDGLHFAPAGLNTEGDDFFQLYQGWPRSGGSAVGRPGVHFARPGLDADRRRRRRHHRRQPGLRRDHRRGRRRLLRDPRRALVAGARSTTSPLASDRLDLSALLQKVGYHGADPVADHYVTLPDDGAGGTEVLFDDDGAGPSPQ